MGVERDIILDLPALLKQAALKSDVVLQPHQERVLGEAGPDTRKLLYHTLGSGKTLSAIAAAEAMKAPYGAVVPAALRANFEKEREKFTDEKRKSDTQSYTMLSKGMEPVHDKTVIFDEAHRLRNPQSKRTIAAKELANKAQQLYLLSGSPIVNAPKDMAPLVEMLTQQPMSPEQFDDEFLGSERVDPSRWQKFRGMKPGVRNYLKQPRKFEKLLKGKVDYHQPDAPAVERVDEDIFVDMGPEQQLLHKAFYNEIPRSLQRKLEKNFPLSKSEARNLLAFMTGPRQAALSTHPWLSEKQRVAAGISQTPKLQRAMSELEKQIEDNPKSRTVVFSNFIDAGLKPYAAALEAKKIPYGIFHGGLTDKQRADVVNKYNSGELRALLLGPAASEGISLSGTNLMQLLDPHWNESRLEQAVGRGIRFDSHGHLPKEEQKVRVQRYISQLPKGRRSVLSGFKRPTRDTADTFLQNYAHEKQRVNDLFLAKLRDIGTPKQAAVTHIGGASGAGKTTVLEGLREKYPELALMDLDDLDFLAYDALKEEGEDTKSWGDIGEGGRVNWTDENMLKWNTKKQQGLDQFIEDSKDKDVVLAGVDRPGNHSYSINFPEDMDKVLLNTGALRSAWRAHRRDKRGGRPRGLLNLPSHYREARRDIKALKSLGYTPQSQAEVIESFGKQSLDREILRDLPGLLKKASSSFLQSGSLAPRGNPTMRSFTAGTPAEGFFGEYESVGEWANELPDTVFTRPSEGSFWKGNIKDTATSWFGRGMKRKMDERQQMEQLKHIQAMWQKRKEIDASNQAWSAAMQSQPTTTVDSPWGKQQSGPVGMPHINAGYNQVARMGGPSPTSTSSTTWFHDFMDQTNRSNPGTFELSSSTPTDSTYLDKTTGMRYTIPNAGSSSNKFEFHAEQPSMGEWANAMRFRQGKPARTV